MAYVEQDVFLGLFNAEINDIDFKRFSREASLHLDNMTRTVDGVNKLREYFPSNDDDKEAVEYAASKVIYYLYQMDELEKQEMQKMKTVQFADGTVSNGLVASRSSGSESITYANTQSAGSAIASELSDRNAKKAYIADMISELLGGVCDSNGVPLLYMGPYPL